MPSRGSAAKPRSSFDPLAPFADRSVLDELVDALGSFRWKLYGPIPVRFHRGRPTQYEFDVNLGVVHVTEQDFRGLSEIFRRLNREWGTRMTFCIYPSKERARDLILNVRGSPRAPSEID
jgi:hypothetical protein